MKKHRKIRIKSWKRFIGYSLTCLLVFVITIVAGGTAIAHIVSASGSQENSTTPSPEAKNQETSVPASSQSENKENVSNTSTQIVNLNNIMPDPQDEVSADDPYKEIKDRLRADDTEGLKVIFLSFDDGPSANTPAVLDMLDTYGIKATFFTNHHQGQDAADNYRRIVEEGHTLGNHTSSHLYEYYKDTNLFLGDVQSLRDYHLKVTGIEPPKIFRFPGGSLNANEACVQAILNAGYTYVDWNVVAGDGYSDVPAPSVIAANIINGCHQHDVSVVLCHAELKENTRAALPSVIETLQSEGYTFLPMEEDFYYPHQLEI